jgi:hypothetical protein
MGRQIIKQPDGKYALFSTISDGFLIRDTTPEGIVEFLMEDSRRDLQEYVDQVIEKLDAGRRPYYQFTLSWKEAVKLDERNHRDV